MPFLFLTVYPGGCRKDVQAKGDHGGPAVCHDIPVHPGGLGEDVEAEGDHEAAAGHGQSCCPIVIRQYKEQLSTVNFKLL
jgi:hypothetical protein